ncbi:hypothetical protein [Puniceicoccus vermicola]|uniref:Tfp pilus assembly protein PilO n=1 Tax=Puniceicoccus vermicola TaxID=388746 RepID=A0A7X1E5A7_9BACT|nr:hypothetical protein [Puniceicoccus vermicola]MBC2601402.1 hypothetical protein [Puniceicoccus vermicola]
MKLSLPPLFRKFAIPAIAGIFVLICLLIFFLRFSTLSDLKTSISEAEREVLTMRRNIKSSENLESQLETIEALTDRLQERTIEPEDTAVNTAYFYQFETDQVQIESVEQRNTPVPKSYSPWKMKNFGTTLFTIRATGSFQQLLYFIFQIRGGEKIVRLINFSIIPADGEGEKIRRITLTLEALTSPPQKKQ